MSDEIVRDIDRWSKTKLRLWFSDSLVRYDMADVDPDEALKHIAANLLVLLSQAMLALNAPPDKAGRRLAKLIRFAGKQRKKCKGDYGPRSSIYDA
jgi:hypothetical protein